MLLCFACGDIGERVEQQRVRLAVDVGGGGFSGPGHIEDADVVLVKPIENLLSHSFGGVFIVLVQRCEVDAKTGAFVTLGVLDGQLGPASDYVAE